MFTRGERKYAISDVICHIWIWHRSKILVHIEDAKWKKSELVVVATPGPINPLTLSGPGGAESAPPKVFPP